MHEFTIASSIVNSLLEALEGYPGAERVDEVDLVIGELSFAGIEQVTYCFSVLIEERERLKGCKLNVITEEGRAHCRECGYDGPLDMGTGQGYHHILPVFACPKCAGEVNITAGESVSIRNAKLIMKDEVE